MELQLDPLFISQFSLDMKDRKMTSHFIARKPPFLEMNSMNQPPPGCTSKCWRTSHLHKKSKPIIRFEGEKQIFGLKDVT